VDTILQPFLGAKAHAIEQINSVALDPTQISPISQFNKFAVDFRRGIMAFFSEFASNSAAPQLAKELAHSRFSLCATSAVVAILA
jgi:hypothetical protein